MLPVAGGPLLLEVGDQLSPHADDAVSHAFHFLQPVGKHPMQLQASLALTAKPQLTAFSPSSSTPLGWVHSLSLTESSAGPGRKLFYGILFYIRTLF